MRTQRGHKIERVWYKERLFSWFHLAVSGSQYVSVHTLSGSLFQALRLSVARRKNIESKEK